MNEFNSRVIQTVDSARRGSVLIELNLNSGALHCDELHFNAALENLLLNYAVKSMLHFDDV